MKYLCESLRFRPFLHLVTSYFVMFSFSNICINVSATCKHTHTRVLDAHIWVLAGSTSNLVAIRVDIDADIVIWSDVIHQCSNNINLHASGPEVPQCRNSFLLLSYRKTSDARVFKYEGRNRLCSTWVRNCKILSPMLLYQHYVLIVFSVNERDNLCLLLFLSASHANCLLLLTLPDTCALHSWHIASLRSKKHHTADIFPPARNVFYCTKSAAR